MNVIPHELKNYVVIGAPHTSNWDFITGMSLMYMHGGKPRFLIKADWMKFPFNLFLRPLGALGIDRSAIAAGEKSDSTGELAKIFNDTSGVNVWISPEGTRSANNRWKSGFYYIAHKAQVPIVCCYADWAKKELGAGLVIDSSLSKEEVMHKVAHFYRKMQGKNQENFLIDERYL